MDSRQEADSQDKKESHPPIKSGTLVRTTQKNEAIVHHWTPGELVRRKWGMLGKVEYHGDLPRLCYNVLHADGTTGWYDPTELHVFESRFKVGDRVRIALILDKLTSPKLIGKRGVVEEVDALSNGNFNYTLEDGTYVHEEMLEAE